jgi:2-methylisocitrate lyase-like PEP mutase family enzyme
MTHSSARDRLRAFRELHEGPQILVLPGVWDVVSARVFAAAGFPALGTTSAGVAWSLGRATGEDAPWPLFLDVCRRIAAAVRVPVSFDLESGFGTRPEIVRERVQEAIEAGACGVNLEDGFIDRSFADAGALEEKIAAVRELCRELEIPLFVNARTDVYLGGIGDETKRLDETLRRALRYAQAGADGIFVPGLAEVEAIRILAREIPRPLNIYAGAGVPSAARLAELGARRVSMGCGPLQALLARACTIAEATRRDGEWTSFTEGALEYAEAAALGGDSRE